MRDPMTPLAAIAILLLGSGAASAQAPRFFCAPFSPDRIEVEAILERLQPAVPEMAELESACYTTELRQTGAQTLSSVQHERFTFSWPTNEHVSGVRFYRKATCSREESGDPRCSDAGRFAEWKGSLTDFDQSIGSFELVGVLAATESLMPRAIALQRIDRTYVSETSRRFAGVRRYELVSVESDGKYWYRLERECTTAADCAWKATPVGRYHDPLH
jgi:hypothetical protein